MTEPVTPVAVVLPDRRDQIIPSLTPVGKAEALTVLLASCLNTGPDREWDARRGWSRLTSVARAVECYQMMYTSPRQGAEILHQLLS